MTEESVRFPAMRADLCDYLESLSDASYQERVWIGREQPAKRDSLDDVVHFFYDDTKLAESPRSCIGDILRDELEATKIAHVVSALDAVFDVHGFQLQTEQYLALVEWASVVEASRAAHTVICGHEDA